MGFLGKILKILLAIFLSLVLTTALFSMAAGFSIKETALSPSTYSDLLEKANSYELFQEQVSKLFSKSLSQAFTQAEAAQLARNAFSKKWFDGQVNGLLENILGYLKSEKQSLDLKISLIEPKKQLKIALSEKLKQMAGGQLPPGTDLSTALDKQIPDSMDLTQFIGNAKPQIDSAKKAIALFSTILIGLAVLAIIVIIVAFFAFKAKKWAIFCFQSFLTSAVLVFIFPIILASVLEKPLSGKIGADAVSTMLKQLINEFMAKFTAQLNIFAIAYFIISMAFLAIFVFFWFNGKKQIEKAKESGKK